MADLKNRKRVNLTLDIDLYKKIIEISKETDVPVSRMVDKALKEKYLKEV